MAIYEQGYRPYLGKREALGTRPFVIAKQAIRGAWSKRGVKVIFIGALLVLLGSAIFLYLGWKAMGAIAENPMKNNGGFGGGGGGGILGDIAQDPKQGFAVLYQGTLLYEGIWVFILAMSVLCGLVAHDRRSGAIPLYLTRAISREQYLYGKLLASGSLCGLILVVPCVIMMILDYGFSLPGMGTDALWRGFSAVLVGVLWGAIISATVVAVSTLTSRPRLAAVFCAAAAFIPMIGVGILFDVFRDSTGIFSVLSPLMLAFQSAEVLLDINRGLMGSEFPVLGGAWPIVFLLGWTVLLFWFARWRIRILGDVRE
jgi:ABC-type transport system involved in multi-copper enzyme maturation permease subunit